MQALKWTSDSDRWMGSLVTLRYCNWFATPIYCGSSNRSNPDAMIFDLGWLYDVLVILITVHTHTLKDPGFRRNLALPIELSYKPFYLAIIYVTTGKSSGAGESEAAL